MTNTESQRLERSKGDRIIAGICGGLGKYFNTDPLLIRIVFVLLGIYGAGLIIYIILWIILPQEGESVSDSEDTHQKIKEGANKMAEEIKEKISRDNIESMRKRNGNVVVGLIVLLLGLLLLAQNFIPGFEFAKLWPLLLIAFGIIIIANSSRS